MYPSVLTILPTYQCTAACKECCFECSPKVHGRIPLDRILRYIDQAAQSFPTIKLVCFSGGECFLLGNDLDQAIARAHQLGLRTRCVTNGYWATSPKAARDRLSRLAQSGLDELNISTGDDHLEYVPFERVVDGSIAAAELGMTSLIVVEGFEGSRFKMDDVFAHPRLRAFWEASASGQRLQVFQNVWMPFYADRKLTHEEKLHRTPERLPQVGGCDNVLHNAVVTPDESLASCCGLTMEHIPEMKLGKLADRTMAEMVDRGMRDFVKRWIWLDGPDAVLWFAHQKDARVPYPDKNVHPCQACAQFYLSPLAKEAVRTHWHEVRDDVLLRYQIKVNLLQHR